MEMDILDMLKKRYCIEGTNEFGIHSSRRRYKVTCLECGSLIHEATTGVGPMCEQHDSEECTAAKKLYAAGFFDPETNGCEYGMYDGPTTDLEDLKRRASYRDAPGRISRIVQIMEMDGSKVMYKPLFEWADNEKWEPISE